MGKRIAASKKWAVEVEKAMKMPAPPTTRTRAELEAAIAEISAQLKGPLDGGARLDLVESRSIFRKQLETLT